jgi:predicted ribosome quality control (RQC) complex YloA/Tae2 family protein
VGGHVQKVRVARLGSREVALLEVRVPGETRHVVVAEGLGVGLLDAEGRGRLRAAMAAAGKPGAARALALAAQATAAMAGVGPEGPEREALEARGNAIVAEVAEGAVAGRREELRRALGRALARVARRVEAVKGDLAKAEGAGAIAARAQLFVVEASRAPRGATELAIVDWSTGEAREAKLPLDPARGAREQLDAMFRRAKRLKEGARVAQARLADAEKTHAALRALADRVETVDEEGLADLTTRARTAAPRDFKLVSASASASASGSGSASASAPAARSRSRSRAQPPLPPYRTFLSSSGARLLVGRGADRNDDLTFHVARPHDLWLHAKNRAGAHVVVPLDRGASCPADVLVDAAHLAAHFSEARDEAVVEVQYAPRRHLRKPRGSAPGLVVVDRERVLVLRREDARMRTLLERETE